MTSAPFAEVVFGFVYPVGANADPVENVLKNYLTQYEYKTEEFRISNQLRSLDLGISFEKLSKFAEMGALMDAGNAARERSKSDSILAVMAVNDIADKRQADEQKRPMARERVAHLVRSLKRPEEVRLLREIYRPGFYLIGIADDDDSQRAFLTDEMGLDDDQARRLMQRDQDERRLHGQRTRDTFYLADVFVELREDKYKAQLARFLDLVFGHPFRTPHRDEHVMFMAYASAARSAQLGRQVGAAVATPEGEVLSVGMNEVPCPRGGPYWETDEDDRRDHKEKIDSNFQHRDLIVKSILKTLDDKLMTAKNVEKLVRSVLAKTLPHGIAGAADPNRTVADLMGSVAEMTIADDGASKAIHSSDLRDITEYGRAVHAEMDAILTCARLGISVRNKYLYVTTFPCHNCTRHIIAAGIKKVFYIEPYPKSKARDLHSDAICFTEREAKKSGRIPFVPFVGIGPRRYLDLFSLELSSGRTINRKDESGAPVQPIKRKSPPRVPMIAFSYLEREYKLLAEFNDILKELQGEQDAKGGAEEPHGMEPHQNGGPST